MAFGLFKDGNELLNEAKDEINRKEYSKALKTLEKCVAKTPSISSTVDPMMSFIRLGEGLNNPSAYVAMATSLKKNTSGVFEFGLSSFDSEKLATECECMAECISAKAMPSNDRNASKKKGEALIASARNLQSKVGTEILQINYFFNNSSQSGLKLALSLMAEGNELISSSWFWEDPRKAAEFQQAAYNFRRQLGENGEANQLKIKQFTKSCNCWICGRETMGEGMHFYRMSSEVSPQQFKDGGTSISETKDSVFVCRGCFSAISRRSDEISKRYYDNAMAQMREMEMRIQRRIDSLERSIDSVRYSR